MGIPSWNGSPESWKTYKDEVRIWVLGSPCTADYSLCARLVAHLKGPARRVGLGMTDEELQPTALEADEHAEPPRAQEGGNTPPSDRHPLEKAADICAANVSRPVS